MNGLSSVYLNEVAKFCLKKFIQVIPCDYLHYYNLRQGDQFIVNLSDSSKPGTHFIAISVKKGHCVFFDSFGLPCHNSYILEKMQTCRKNLIFSTLQIQSMQSFMCGFYSLAFLISDQNKSALADFLQLFDTKDILNNDEICIQYIKSHIDNMK